MIAYIGDRAYQVSLAVTLSAGPGFSYHLSEMAFFNWFFGGPSVGVNGWYSDNATFLNDAGPICQP